MADTTSQAEAQAPTTAASVLTEQERQARNDMAITAANLRTLAELRIENPGCTLPINVDFLKSVAKLSTWAIAALTVGASAPAPIPEHVRKAAAFQRARMDALAADPDEIAPAPTMPTRAQVSYLLELLAKEGVSNDGGDFMRRKMTDAILALITKGDTP